MDKKIIQAYLWQEIIRMGFSPSSDKDKKSWLRQYGKSNIFGKWLIIQNIQLLRMEILKVVWMLLPI